jgi:lipopolysaccharide biosynthesis glycosyltransferase
MSNICCDTGFSPEKATADTAPSIMILHIAAAFDRNYFGPFYAFLSSLISSNGQHSICLHVIATGINNEERDEVRHYAQTKGVEVVFYPVDDDYVSRFVITGKWTGAAYYRLFFPMLVPADVQRLLYIDVDALVVGDLAPLYTESLDDYPLGAVYDNYVKKQPLLGIKEEGRYFNSGMLLINTSVWRSRNISERAIAYMQEHPDHILFVDQCALNAVLIDSWKQLPPQYNLLTSYLPEIGSYDKTAFLRTVTVLHFTLNRPWQFLSTHPYRRLYRHYLKNTPYRGRRIVDFSFDKMLKKVKLALWEFYMQSPVIRKTYQHLKRTFTSTTML